MQFLRKIFALFIAANLLSASLSFSHPCTKIYDNAIASISKDSLWTATLPLWGGLVGALGVAFGAGAIVVSPLFLLGGVKPAAKLAGAGLACVGAGAICAIGTATSVVTVPIYLTINELVRKNLKKTRDLLQEIDDHRPGHYTIKLAKAAEKENDIEDFFSDLKHADFCPLIAEKHNLKELNNHGVFDFGSLEKIAAREKAGDIDAQKYAQHIRFTTKFSRLANNRRYGLVGKKKVARVVNDMI